VPPAIGVDPVVEQKRDAVGVGVVVGDEDERVLEQELRLGPMLAEPLGPRPAACCAEPVGEKKLEVVVLGPEVAVVDRLIVVRIGARLKEQRRESAATRGAGLVRGILAIADRGRERCEQVGAVAEIACVRVGAVIEQKPRDGNVRVAGIVADDARVRDVEDRLPGEGPRTFRRIACRRSTSQGGATGNSKDMNAQRPAETQPWMLFAFPAAIVVPIIAGFLVGGPVLGFLVAGLVAVVIVGVAIGMEPRRSRTGDTRSETGRAPADTDGQHWRRAAGRRLLVPLVIAGVGIALMTTTSDTVSIIGWGTFAVAITLAISIVFLEIGYSEDRARAREERARSRTRHRRARRSTE
jgi:hypothetical protein